MPELSKKCKKKPCLGFGGFGALLRWKVDFDVFNYEEDFI